MRPSRSAPPPMSMPWAPSSTSADRATAVSRRRRCSTRCCKSSTKTPLPPSRLQPDTPSDLETICLKCLYKNPKRRYASAKELADDLDRFLNDDPIQARPASTWEKTRHWCKKNPRKAIFLTSAIVTSLLVGSMLAKPGRCEGERREIRSRDAKRPPRLWLSPRSKRNKPIVRSRLRRKRKLKSKTKRTPPSRASLFVEHRSRLPRMDREQRLSSRTTAQ